MLMQKKAGLGKKSWFVTASSHGFGVDSPLEARVSGGPAAQALPRRPLPAEAPSSGTQAPSLRLSLSISLYLSLPRLSQASRVSEAFSESPPYTE